MILLHWGPVSEAEMRGTAYHAGRCVVCLNVVHQIIASQGPDVLSRAQDCSAQGTVLEGCCMQVVKDNLLCHTLNLHDNDNNNCHVLSTTLSGNARCVWHK